MSVGHTLLILDITSILACLFIPVGAGDCQILLSILPSKPKSKTMEKITIYSVVLSYRNLPGQNIQ